MTALTAVAIGDVFVDYVTDLTGAEHQSLLEDVKSSTNMFAPIQVLTGGAGVQFAVAAKQAGFPAAYLLGKMGGRIADNDEVLPDVPANEVLSHLESHSVKPLIAISPHTETGRIVILYLPSDRRLMISDSLANTTFCVDDITEAMKQAVAAADLVHVSGYTFLQPERRRAVMELMHTARAAGRALIAVDLVPHDLYQYLDTAELCRDLKDVAQMGLIELPTASRFVLGRQLPARTPQVINEVLEGLAETFSSIVLNLDPSQAIVVHSGRRWTQRMQYSPGLSSRGQSAEAQAELLYGVISQDHAESA